MADSSPNQVKALSDQEVLMDTIPSQTLLSEPSTDEQASGLEVPTDQILAPMDCENEIQHHSENEQALLSSKENPAVQEDHISKDDHCNLIVGEATTSVKDSKELEVSKTGLTQKSEHENDDNEKAVLLCRLCAIPCQGSALVALFQHPPHHPEVLQKRSSDDHDEESVGDVLSMIKATLPIKVSCCDSLPKHVCKVCIERLRLSHAFVATVLKAESQLNSLRTLSKTSDCDELNIVSGPVPGYDCPVCKEAPALLHIQSEPHTRPSGSYAWGNVVIKNEPEDCIEPSQEEIEKSYNDLFGGHDTIRMEERITLKPSKPACATGKRPRGRPRTRPLKVTPRGRRGRRSTQTTVEKILELGGALPADEEYGFQIRSRENNPASEALTQCLLCDRWLPGAASCLQHSLVEHLDCGAFLCPRCPRDDFPGDFELIQHYQESHCPDLELYEVFQVEKSHPNIDVQPSAPPEKELEGNHEQSEPSTLQGTHLIPEQDSAWAEDTMDYETLHNTPPNELYESQDELSSNLSEVAPRSLTSHSALFEEESNSLSTHGSDSNMATDDVLNIPSASVLHNDELRNQEQNITSVDSGSIREPSSLLVSAELPGDPRTDDCKLMELEQQGLLTAQNANHHGAGKIGSLNNDPKIVQVENQESQDSIRADDLCGFQEAISEKSQEVSLNGNDFHYDTHLPSSEGTT